MILTAILGDNQSTCYQINFTTEIKFAEVVLHQGYISTKCKAGSTGSGYNAKTKLTFSNFCVWGENTLYFLLGWVGRQGSPVSWPKRFEEKNHY